MVDLPLGGCNAFYQGIHRRRNQGCHSQFPTHCQSSWPESPVSRLSPFRSPIDGHFGYNQELLVGSVRKRMKTFFVAFLCLLYIGGGLLAKKKFVKSKLPVTEKPHIVFILADDLGWNEVLKFL